MDASDEDDEVVLGRIIGTVGKGVFGGKGGKLEKGFHSANFAKKKARPPRRCNLPGVRTGGRKAGGRIR